MHLFLVRHGQTQYNAERRYLGALDPELNATGVLQATDLRAVLPPALDAIVCSPLRRARHVGVFEGLTQMEAQLQFPELWAHNITRQWHSAPTGGETIAEVVERVTAGLRVLSVQYAGKHVALVAHGFVAKVLRAVSLTGFGDFFDWQLENGAVLELCLTGAHLPTEGMPLPPT